MSKELEALKSIKGTVISSTRGDWGFEYRYVSDIESTRKHFNLIEQALKRNEPMKVKVDLTTEHIWFYKCPNCGVGFNILVFLPSMEGSSYCPDCGQRLDWSEVK